MSKEIEEAMNVIKQAMIDDNPSEPGSYAHSWHCNIAMMCADAVLDSGVVVGPLYQSDAREIGNDAASRFMKLCFDVETKGD